MQEQKKSQRLRHKHNQMHLMLMPELLPSLIICKVRGLKREEVDIMLACLSCSSLNFLSKLLLRKNDVGRIINMHDRASIK